MNRYETLVILYTSLNDEQKEAVLNKYLQMIEKADGKIQVVNKWGVKKLAYPINYKADGYYALIEFDSAPELPKEINDLMRIDENVMRFLTIKKEVK